MRTFVGVQPQENYCKDTIIQANSHSCSFTPSRTPLLTLLLPHPLTHSSIRAHLLALTHSLTDGSVVQPRHHRPRADPPHRIDAGVHLVREISFLQLSFIFYYTIPFVCVSQEKSSLLFHYTILLVHIHLAREINNLSFNTDFSRSY